MLAIKLKLCSPGRKCHFGRVIIDLWAVGFPGGWQPQASSQGSWEAEVELCVQVNPCKPMPLVYLGECTHSANEECEVHHAELFHSFSTFRKRLICARFHPKCQRKLVKWAKTPALSGLQWPVLIRGDLFRDRPPVDGYLYTYIYLWYNLIYKLGTVRD